MRSGEANCIATAARIAESGGRRREPITRRKKDKRHAQGEQQEDSLHGDCFVKFKCFD